MGKDLLGISIQEKMRILEMHYNAAGKKLINEQAENTEPDLSKYDWSNNGSVDFWKANTDAIIDYIIARDASKSYSKLQVYMPVMEWFKDVKKRKMSDEDVKKSLYIWVGKDPYYGLAAARANVKQASTEDEGVEGAQYDELETKESKEESAKRMNDLATKWETEVINQLNGTSDIDGKVKAQLAMIPKSIRSAIQSKIYLPDDILTKLEKGINDYIKTKDKPNTNVKAYGFYTKGGFTQQDLTNATKAKTSVQGYLTGGKDKDNVYTDTAADDNIRLKLLSDIQTQVDEIIKNPQKRDKLRSGRVIELSIPKVISEADNIQFEEGTATVEGQESGVGTQKTVELLRVLNFSYPAEDTPQDERDVQADNFFGDDKTTISGDAEEAMDNIAIKIKDLIVDLQKRYGADKVRVLNIGVATYASTSTVNSSFGTGAAFKTPKAFNKGNNIRLVNARLNAMDTAFKESLTQVLSEVYDSDENAISDKITTLVKQAEPNKGPEWTSMGGSNYDATYGIQNYGPLYQAAYAEDKNKTPREFYGNRNTDELKKDYEISYAGYRKSMVAVSVQLYVPEEIAKQTPSGEFVITSVGNYSASIVWWQRSKIEINWPKIGKIKFGSRQPRGFMPPFKGRTTNCPIF
jgi:hypothetical protein